MKRISLTTILFFYLQFLNAQEINGLSEEMDSINVADNGFPMEIVESPLIYPGCSGTKQEKKSCLNKSIQVHAANNFRKKIIKSLKLTKGKHKIYLHFKTSHTGDIIDIKARGPHKKLEKEGIRVIKLLPKMIPGQQKGKNINVTYMVPITFATI